MKSFSLSAKIVGIVVVSVVVVGLTLTACTWYFMTRIYSDESRQEVSRLAGLVQSYVADEARKLASAAQMTAARQDLAEAIAKGDTAVVQKLGKDIMRDSRISLITIADKEGKVVGRGHSDKAGDSVLAQANVRKALGGEVTTGIEEGTVVKFSMRAGAPVKLGDKLVGSITTGTDLTSADHAFVERLKKEFGTECTIFQGDTRVTTTLMKDGQRAVGTKIDNPKVLDSVLAKGQQFQDVNTILEKEYDTAYWPVKDHTGKIAGMFFIGKDRGAMNVTLRNAMLTIAAVVSLIGLVMVAAGFFIARSVTRPVQHVIQGITDSAEQFVSVSNQVSSASQSLAQGSSEQAASIEETSSSLEEMSSMTKQNADNASAADNLMKQSRLMVDKANGSMTELTQSMEDISKASDETSKIIKTIDEIAFQTNLLALNAAVEAARAGRGRCGFCRGGQRGEKPRHAGCRGRQEHGRPHRRHGEEGQGGLGARRANQRGFFRSIEERRQGGRSRFRDCRGLRRAGPGHRPGQQGRLGNGEGHPAVRRQRRGIRRRRGRAHGPGRAAQALRGRPRCAHRRESLRQPGIRCEGKCLCHRAAGNGRGNINKEGVIRKDTRPQGRKTRRRDSF